MKTEYPDGDHCPTIYVPDGLNAPATLFEN